MRHIHSLLKLLVIACLLAISAFAQTPSPAPSEPGTVFKAQTSLVLVDAVVTDKHGNYLKDLSGADFRVWEDGKEQTIKTFSSESTADAESRKQYLIILFDDVNSSFDEQSRSRTAALEFIDTEVANGQFVAIARFDNSLQITQNFTRNAQRLKDAALGKKTLEGTEVAGPAVVTMQGDFRARNLLLALRSLAMNLSKVPGRKALLLLSPGFPLNSDRTYELSAAIDACNRSNVAIYAVNVRGLTSLPVSPSERPGRISALRPRAIPATLTYGGAQPGFFSLALNSSAFGSTRLLPTQTGTGGGQTPTPPRTPIGINRPRPSGTSTNTTRRTIPPKDYRAPNAPPGPRRENMPWFSGTSNFNNRDVLHALAEGTGGYVFENSNDLLAGLNRIGQEQSHYYILGYTPPESEAGKCHTLKVRLQRDNSVVRARRGYCSVAALDQLAGTPVQTELEKVAAGQKPQTVKASMGVSFFYRSTNTARVTLALDIPSGNVKLTKEKGKTRGSIEVMGTALNADQSIAARFSDKVPVELEDDNAQREFKSKPYHYEKQFEVASGNYDLHVAFKSGDEAFGQLHAPLVIEPFDSNAFSVSGIAFSTSASGINEDAEMLERELLEDRYSLVSHGVQYLPSGTTSFEKSGQVFLYVEIYEPLLAEKKTPRIGIQYVVVDRATKEVKLDTGLIELDRLIQPSNPVIPAGLRLPLDSLTPGTYHLELRASDSENRSHIRTAEFEVR